MRHIKFITSILLIFCFTFSSCSQSVDNRNVEFFKGTKAYGLAKAVYYSDLEKIEELVKKDSTLLSVTNPTSGSNVLELCLYIEKCESFKKLLELGANPNFINPQTHYSVLINSCKYYYEPEAYTVDLRYTKLLLEHGADPNYAVEEEFEKKRGHYVMPTSPLREASTIDLEMVKLLIKHGANPYHKIEEDSSTPFSEAVSSSKFNIINYYIDSLEVNVKQPMKVRTTDTLFIQDYVNKFMSYKDGSEQYKKTQELKEKLKRKGVNFEDYKYNLK